MRHLKNRSGFTLLEIIIVVIIIGVLASLALPRFFKTIEFSRSAEALSQIAAVRSSIERCYAVQQNYANCDDITALDIENPNSNDARLFGYNIVGASGTAGYTIVALRGTQGSVTAPTAACADPQNCLELVVTGSTVTRSGTGNFSGIH